MGWGAVAMQEVQEEVGTVEAACAVFVWRFCGIALGAASAGPEGLGGALTVQGIFGQHMETPRGASSVGPMRTDGP